MLKQTLSLALASCWLSSLPSSAQDLTQQDINMGTLYGAPSNPNDLLEYTDRTYMDQIVNDADWSASTGCLDVFAYRKWNGTSGGNCANTDGLKDTYTFGYNTTVISQTQDAINDALKVAGVNVVGYLWQWKVKNADTNYETTNGVRGQDPLYVRVIVKDTTGNVLDEREWDYSYHIDNWEQKNGMQWFDPFIQGNEIDTITLEVEAKDAGYWAGWYGPEFGSAGIYSIFVYKDPLDCSDPLNDASCPGYAMALQEQQQAMLEEQLALAEMTNESASVEEIIEEPVIEEVIEEPQPEPVAEVVEDVIQEVFEEPMGVAGDVEGEISNDTVVGSGNSSRIRVNPLDVARGAIADAAAVANSAISSAATSSTQSDQQSTSFVMEQAQESAELSFEMEEQLIENVQAIASNVSQQQFAALNLEENILHLEIIVEDVNTETTSEALNNIISQVTSPTFELKLPEPKEEIAEPMSTMEEAELVAKAFEGSDDEDARSALMGYNPLFSQYEQQQLADADFYKPKDIYPEQENYDNPNARFFNGASDEKHNAMVRQQYERN